MVDIHLNISLISLNINGLSAQLKDRMSEQKEGGRGGEDYNNNKLAIYFL